MWIKIQRLNIFYFIGFFSSLLFFKPKNLKFLTVLIQINKGTYMKTIFQILFFFILLGINSISFARNAPLNCAIKTYNGRYLTAVGGGGRIIDVIRSYTTVIGNYERFVLVDTGDGSLVPYGFRTYNGNYLSVQGGGGRITDVIRSNVTWIREWERLGLVSQGNGWYAIRTYNGNYLTAVGGGGRTTDVIHSDATRIGTWEMFQFIGCYTVAQ